MIQSVAGIIFSDNKCLLIKRRDVPVWVLPGGGVDAEENPEDAIMREILEETGFTVKIVRLVGDYKAINRLAKRTHLYVCEIMSGTPTLSSETKEVAFFPLDALPPMPPPYPEWVADALLNVAPLQKQLTCVNYRTLLKHCILHPILVFRFLLARMGVAINS